jgi:hypothetical protein
MALNRNSQALKVFPVIGIHSCQRYQFFALNLLYGEQQNALLKHKKLYGIWLPNSDILSYSSFSGNQSVLTTSFSYIPEYIISSMHMLVYHEH